MMKFFNGLFKPKATARPPATSGPAPAGPAAPASPNPPSAGQKKRALSLEGTRFPLFSEEAGFFEECRNSGQAVILIPFTEYWPISGRGMQAKAISGGIRLLCSSCLVDMPMSFSFSLPGGMSFGGMVAVGEGLPSNLFSAAKAACCPHCGTDKGLLLWDHPKYGEITAQDMQALRALWRFRSQLWWKQNNRTSGICDRCNARMQPGEGYHTGSDVICETCAQKSTDTSALESLKKNPDWYGTSELHRARTFQSGAYRLERGAILNPE